MADRVVRFKFLLEAPDQQPRNLVSALTKLDDTLKITEKQVEAAHKELEKYRDQTNRTEAQTKALIDVEKVLQQSVAKTSDIYRRITSDLTVLERQQAQLAGTLDGVTNKIKSLAQVVNAPVSSTRTGLSADISQLRTELQKLRFDSDKAAEVLQRVFELERIQRTRSRRRDVAAQAAAAVSGTSVEGYGASNLGDLPDTLNGLQARLAEINDDLANLERPATNVSGSRFRTLANEARDIQREIKEIQNSISGIDNTFDRVYQRREQRAERLRQKNEAINRLAKERQTIDKRNEVTTDQRGDRIIVASGRDDDIAVANYRRMMRDLQRARDEVIRQNRLALPPGDPNRPAIRGGARARQNLDIVGRPDVSSVVGYSQPLPVDRSDVRISSGSRSDPREITALYQTINKVGNAKNIANIERMGKSFKDVANDIKAATKASNNTVSSLNAQRQAWQQLKDSVDISSKEYRQAGKEIDKVNKKLAKSKTLASRFKSAGDTLTTVAGAGFLAGPEAGLGAAVGGILGGRPGATIGAEIGFAASEFRRMASAAAEAAAAVRRLEIALEGSTTVIGDTAASARNLTIAKTAIGGVVAELNIPLQNATRDFTRLNAAVTGAGGNATDASLVFRGVADAIKATGGGNRAAEGAMIALTQVFSKGKASAEEISNQLAERLPGAMVQFANATNRTLPELQAAFREGVVDLNDVMKFSVSLSEKYSQTALKVAQSSAEAGNRLKTALDIFSVSVGTALEPAGAAFQDFFTDLTLSTVNLLKQIGLVEEGLEKLGSAGRAIDLGKRLREIESPQLLRLYNQVRLFDSLDLDSTELKKIVQLVLDIDQQKNIPGLEQNLFVFEELAKKLKEMQGDLEGADEKTRKFFLRNLQGRIEQTSASLEELRKNIKATEFDSLTNENFEAVRTREENAAKKIVDLRLRQEERIRRFRFEYEKEAERIRLAAVASVERIEQRLIEQRQQSEQRITDIRRNIERLQEDGDFQLRLANPNLTDLQRQLLEDEKAFEQNRREAEDKIREAERALLRDQQENAKAIEQLKVESANKINEFTARAAEKVRRLNEESVRKLEKIKAQSAKNTNELNVLSVKKQIMLYKRGAFYFMDDGMPFPDREADAARLKGTVDNKGLYKTQAQGPAVEALDAGLKALNERIAQVTERLARMGRPIADVPALDYMPQAGLPAPIEGVDTSPAVRAMNEQNAARQRELNSIAELAQTERTFRDRNVTLSSINSNPGVSYLFDQEREAEELNRLRETQKAVIEEGINPAISEQVALTRINKQVALDHLNAVISKNQQDQEMLNNAEQMKIKVNQIAMAEEARLIKNQQLTVQQERMKQLADGMAQAIGGSLSEALSLAIEGVDNLGERLQQVMADLLKSLAKTVMQMLVIKPLVDAMKSGLGNLFGVPDIPSVTSNALGNVYAKNKIVPYAYGGVVNSPTFLPLAGEAGPEAIMPLRRGRDGKLGVVNNDSSGGATNITVNVDAKGTRTEGSDTRGNQLGRVIAIAVQQELIKQRRPGGLLA